MKIEYSVNTIAFANQKGGVGKTTSCLSIGAGLAKAGKRVLLIDIDPQGSLSKSAGAAITDNTPTIYEVLTGAANIQDAVQSIGGKYDIVPADRALSGAEIELLNVPGRNELLKNDITELPKYYDYILIDCPPTLNILTVTALAAANKVVIPMQCNRSALDGISDLRQTIAQIKQGINPQLEIGGIIVTMYDSRATLHKEVLEMLQTAFPGKVFETTVSRGIAAEEAPGYSVDLLEYKPKSKQALQYTAMTEEFIKKMEG
jgi:chromosome partitioning protein